MRETVHIKVVCFSLVKESLGKDEMMVSLPAGSTGSDLENHIRGLADGRLDGIPLRLAVNHDFVDEILELKEGDEVVLIPPVQGG